MGSVDGPTASLGVGVGGLVGYLRTIPTRTIWHRLTTIVGRFMSADSSGFRILNMLNTDDYFRTGGKSANSAVESADYMADFTADPMKIGVWVYAFSLGKWYRLRSDCCGGVAVVS